MKSSWAHFFRRLAATFLVSGATAWSSAMCYAQIAADNATDPIYAAGPNGWDEGDNGGFGFTAWSFDGTYRTPDPGQEAMDDGLRAGTAFSSQHNDLGMAWTLFNPNGPEPDGGTPNPPNDDTDLARVGRGFAPLEPGQTIRVVVDNPTELQYFRGWTVRLTDGFANSCYMGDNCTTPAYDPGTINNRLTVGTFEFFTDGQWYPYDPIQPLFDTDTNAGVQIDVMLTGTQTYELTMTTLDDPNLVAQVSGTLNDDPKVTEGPIRWIQFDFYNTDSDSYPVLVDPREETDFYIGSLEILPKLIGDMDRDRDVDFDDIDDFVLGLNNATQYESIFGVLPSLFGDTDGDEDLDFDDIPGFVAILSGGNAQAIPEPSMFVLAGLGAIFVAGLGVAGSRKRQGSARR